MWRGRETCHNTQTCHNRGSRDLAATLSHRREKLSPALALLSFGCCLSDRKLAARNDAIQKAGFFD